jgi:hypothetical protein
MKNLFAQNESKKRLIAWLLLGILTAAVILSSCEKPDADGEHRKRDSNYTLNGK